MILSGTFRSPSSGTAGPGTVNITTENVRGVEPQEIEADISGAWASDDLPPGTYRVTYSNGWSTQVFAVGDISNIEPARPNPTDSDWIYVGIGDGPELENDWVAFVSPGGDSTPRFKRSGSLVIVEGAVSGDVPNPAEPPAIFTLPEGFRPDRSAFLTGAMADFSSENPAEWTYTLAFFAVTATGQVFPLYPAVEGTFIGFQGTFSAA